MDMPVMTGSLPAAEHTHVLAAHMPVPGFGTLPVNAFVIDGAQPVLVDTGLAVLRGEFMAALRSLLDLQALRWIWITHTDPDHVGNLAAVLAEAPQARVVTTYLGMGKMNMLGIPVDRAFLLNPGQELDVGERSLKALSPPTFDAPETTMAFDPLTGTLFSADCFGALLNASADDAAAVPANSLRDGVVTWATVDAPWLRHLRPDSFDAALDQVRALNPRRVLGSHLPPAEGMAGQLCDWLGEAREAPPFVGPDQAMLEGMMRAQAS